MNKKNIIFGIIAVFIAVVLICFSFYFQTKKVEAGTDDNVFGWAWSENIGWISFNNTSGGGTINYGVDIDENGLFSGYAWSENIGWVSFNQSELSGCPSVPCSSQLDLDTGDLSGWAKVLSISDGWIKLNGVGTDGSPYGVTLNSETGEFEGWAWGSETIGWISFNCNNPETGNVCGTSNYKVETSFSFNLPPTATGLLVEKGDYCGTPSHSFSWQFSDPEGGNQYAYHLQIGTNFDSGKVSSASHNIPVLVAKTPGENQLAYNTAYSWQVKVWDEEDVSSDWISGTNFSTEAHIYPIPDFNWVPSSPAKEELVQFNSGLSECYDINNTKISCSGQTFLWTFPEDIEFATSSSASSENPQLKFLSSGPQTVSLKITDDAGSCSTVPPKTVNIGVSLPEWQEVSP